MGTISISPHTGCPLKVALNGASVGENPESCTDWNWANGPAKTSAGVHAVDDDHAVIAWFTHASSIPQLTIALLSAAAVRSNVAKVTVSPLGPELVIEPNGP